MWPGSLVSSFPIRMVGSITSARTLGVLGAGANARSSAMQSFHKIKCCASVHPPKSACRTRHCLIFKPDRDPAMTPNQFLCLLNESPSKRLVTQCINPTPAGTVAWIRRRTPAKPLLKTTSPAWNETSAPGSMIATPFGRSKAERYAGEHDNVLIFKLNEHAVTSHDGHPSAMI